MALTIGIRFLTNYYAAAQSRTSPVPEWPPHPARVFLSLAAAYFEGDGIESEQKALDWMERLSAPSLQVPEEASVCAAVSSFVPANDRRAMETGGLIQGIPGLKRHRSDRLFQRTHLAQEKDTVYLHWETADPGVHLAALEHLCERVARLGHSTSLVQMWIAKEWRGECLLTPTEGRGQERLRVIRQTGMLGRLSAEFERGDRPTVSTWQEYARHGNAVESEPIHSCFDHRFELFRLEPDDSRFRYLDIVTTLGLTSMLHKGLLSTVTGPIPESISGHRADGSPTDRVHVTLFSIPFVGSRYSDGHLMGVGIALPQGVSRHDERQLGEGLRRLRENGLRMGNLGKWKLLDNPQSPPPGAMLRQETWTGWERGCSEWGTVTPFVFDKHPKAKETGEYLGEAAELVKDACERMGLPRPVEAVVRAVSSHAGVPHSRSFPRMKRKDGSERRHVHVTLRFDRPVVGPILIGAGRYRGYGLMMPMKERA